MRSYLRESVKEKGGGLGRPIRPRCANEPGVNCRAVLSSYKIDLALFLLSFSFANNSESSQTSVMKQKDPVPWFSRTTAREMVRNAELGGRLCFNAESDCGAGELLVRLLGRMPIAMMIGFQISRLQPKIRRDTPPALDWIQHLPPFIAFTGAYTSSAGFYADKVAKMVTLFIKNISEAIHAGSRSQLGGNMASSTSCFDHSARAEKISAS